MLLQLGLQQKYFDLEELSLRKRERERWVHYSSSSNDSFKLPSVTQLNEPQNWRDYTLQHFFH